VIRTPVLSGLALIVAPVVYVVIEAIADGSMDKSASPDSGISHPFPGSSLPFTAQTGEISIEQAKPGSPLADRYTY
jgi:hypothetical protein